MRNAGLDELQVGIKTGGRNNNLRYADDTTLITSTTLAAKEEEEELKNLLIRVKEENERAGLRLNIKKKTKIMASGPITSWQIGVGEGGSSDRFPLLGLQNHCGQ